MSLCFLFQGLISLLTPIFPRHPPPTAQLLRKVV
nr:MAG TPA: hypothetical protein [Caudoviricetes sp.]